MQLTGQCTLDRDKDARYGIWTPELKRAMVQGFPRSTAAGRLADGIEQDSGLDFESRSKWNIRN